MTMVLIPGGTFSMGSNAHYPEERPQHTAEIEPFHLDRHPVTNAQFAEFVRETGYVTTAEQPLDGPEFAAVPPEQRLPGSLCFTPSPGPVDLRNWRLWWRWQTGANWRRPQGPDSTIAGNEDHPVVHVSYVDAAAYAKWAGKRLPTEAEWERAAWAGNEGEEFAWGNELFPSSGLMANTWQGKFPYLNTGANGWRGTSPVGSFPANDFDLVDMIGNVWEWTSTLYSPSHSARPTPAAQAPTCGCSPESMRPNPEVSHVTKGGSHLCAPEYCQRYRPSARSPQTEDSATSHLGFRCARDAE